MDLKLTKVLCLIGLLLVTSGQLLQAQNLGRAFGGGFSRSVTVSNQDGVKTTSVNENGKTFVIREGQEFIEVEYANTYGPDQMEELKEKHPDIHMHVTSFPKKSGDAKVTLTVNVEEKVKAESASDLKAKNEQAFKLYERYTKGGAGAMARFGGVGKIMIKPADIVDREKIQLDVEGKLEALKKRAEKMRREIKGRRGPLFRVPKAKAEAGAKAEAAEKAKSSDKAESSESNKAEDKQKDGKAGKKKLIDA